MLIDLVEWLLRLPVRRPRRVHRSWAVQTKVLTLLEVQALDQLAHCFGSGGDLLPYLGDATRTLRRRHREVPKFGPPSAGKRWQPDWMFSDWAIHHFHLGPDLEAKGERVLRSRRVLFAHVAPDDVYLLDVLPHRIPGGVAWADTGLLETWRREWPSVIEQYELRGALSSPASDRYASTERQMLRQAGVNSPIAIGGGVFMGPGLGLASDRSSTRAVRLADEIRRELNEMEQLFRTSEQYSHAFLFVAEDASLGYFVPSRNTALSFLPARTSECRVTWFFQRLLQEVRIFQGAEMGCIWLPTGARSGKA